MRSWGSASRMRIAICPILDIVIETIMMMRAIAPQLAVEKKVPNK